MTCPDCTAELANDGSCCDVCGWTLAPDGRPRISHRTITAILVEMRRRGTYAAWKAMPWPSDAKGAAT